MSKRIAGTCFVKVDGEVLLLKGSMQVTGGNVTREAITANGRVVGYKEIPVVPQITGQFVVDEKFPMDTLRDNDNMTVVAEFTNGRVYTLSNAHVADNLQIGADDSDVTITFEGDQGLWTN